jgi:exodeoxyribonuclease VII large subunit
MQIVASGSIEVYERDGKYQLYAKEIFADGAGYLYEKFERLKRELAERGLFAPEYKQPIPKYIRTLGVVTAPTGAAVQDIINIARRRNPYVQIILYPAIVQGEQAAASIIKGIRTLEQMKVDVMIVGRGGGSIEDLWAFNEEAVARAIFACETPVISAVGHETDVTIADYVADLRAPTPSAAAELAVFDHGQFLADLEARKRKLDREMGFFLDSVKGRLKRDELKIRIHHPQRIINEKRQRLADIEDVMNRRLEKMLDDSRRGVTMKADTLERIMERRLEQDKKRLALASGKLWGLTPLKKLGQGYGFVTDESGARLASVKQAPVGSKIHVQVADGKLTASVEKSEEAESRRG